MVAAFVSELVSAAPLNMVPSRELRTRNSDSSRIIVAASYISGELYPADDERDEKEEREEGERGD